MKNSHFLLHDRGLTFDLSKGPIGYGWVKRIVTGSSSGESTSLEYPGDNTAWVSMVEELVCFMS